MDFLPITKSEMEARGITQPDFVYVIGDAYVSVDFLLGIKPKPAIAINILRVKESDFR